MNEHRNDPHPSPALSPPIVVCGPTASGKTRLAVTLARRCNAEIISADSRQVYRGLDIGSGKDIDEYDTPLENAVAYHLIDSADPAQVYTLHDYLRDAHRALADIAARGKRAVICGGTGLYVEALLKGYRLSGVEEDPGLREELMRHDRDTLDAMLRDTAPGLWERTDRTSRKRMVRALEIAAARSRGEGANDHEESYPPVAGVVLAVRWPRPELYERIGIRLHERLASGMIEEVRGLLDAGVSPQRLEMLGMEYRYVSRFVLGQIDREEMTLTLEREIRRLAKRQDTWYRGMERRGVVVQWIDRADADAAERAIPSFR